MSEVDSHLAADAIGVRVFYAGVRTTVSIFCRTYCRMSLTGQENIPEQGAFVLAPVHRSFLDTPIASSCT
ncbi:MAG: hypothetical protein F2721_06640, partial [Actinobacteria bacterium]|nr:hypothetical protein [Actinomycetota bacterium]